MALLLVFLSLNSMARDEDEFVWIKGEDPEMLKAIKHARNSLGSFLKKYRKPEKNMSNFKLKVHIKDKFGHEHFWVTPFSETKTGFTGTLANQASVVKSVKEGQKINFTKADVSDWGYVKNGRQFGSFTVCVLLKKMPKEQAMYFIKNHGFQC